jgi:hypothetical protein
MMHPSRDRRPASRDLVGISCDLFARSSALRSYVRELEQWAEETTEPEFADFYRRIAARLRRRSCAAFNAGMHLHHLNRQRVIGDQ